MNPDNLELVGREKGKKGMTTQIILIRMTAPAEHRWAIFFWSAQGGASPRGGRVKGDDPGGRGVTGGSGGAGTRWAAGRCGGGGAGARAGAAVLEARSLRQNGQIFAVFITASPQNG